MKKTKDASDTIVRVTHAQARELRRINARTNTAAEMMIEAEKNRVKWWDKVSDEYGLMKGSDYEINFETLEILNVWPNKNKSY